MSPENSRPPAGLRVLVADDRRDGAEALALLLLTWGCRVRACYSGLECLEAAGSLRPDVAILDLAMPWLDGFRVAEHLRQALPGKLSLIALTGFDDAGHRERARAAGFDHYLVKPADPDILRGLLAALAPG